MKQLRFIALLKMYSNIFIFWKKRTNCFNGTIFVNLRVQILASYIQFCNQNCISVPFKIYDKIVKNKKEYEFVLIFFPFTLSREIQTGSIS